SRRFHRQSINADGRLLQLKCTVSAGGCLQDKLGIRSLEKDRRARDGPMLRVVDHAMHGSKNRGKGWKGCGQQHCRHKIRMTPHREMTSAFRAITGSRPNRCPQAELEGLGSWSTKT